MVDVRFILPPLGVISLLRGVTQVPLGVAHRIEIKKKNRYPKIGVFD